MTGYRKEDDPMTESPGDPGSGTTQFAPPSRKPREEVILHFNDIAEEPVVRQLLDAVPEACALLNRERQIVFANRALTLLLNGEDPVALCGLRPGEALGCVHAFERQEGCGTTESCGICGAVNAILKSRTGVEDVQECRISQRDGKALDLRVSAKPVSLYGRKYTLFTAVDISHEKRRKALERIFFHDIVNTAGALHGFAELLAGTTEEPDSGLGNIKLLSKRLLEEIAAQREALAAESNELAVNVRPVGSLGLVEEVIRQYDGRLDGKNCTIRIDPLSMNATFKSDPVLLRRVLGNFLKNAVEASGDGDAITIGTRQAGKGVEFWIHNPAVMPPEVRLQVFQRSFSTKGTGRGLGTYSAKLITEHFLKGQISFTSSAGEGTVFRATYPAHPA